MQLSELVKQIEDVNNVSVDALANRIIHSLEVEDAIGTEVLVAAVNYQSAKESLVSKLIKLNDM